jgi:hypothetical protein
MRRGSAAGAVYAVLLALVVTGCGSSPASTTDQVRRSPGGAAGRPTPLTAVQAPLPLTPAQEVARVGLRSAEIPASQRVRWPAAGRVVSGPLLPFCASGSAADRHRVARRTVTASVPHSHVVTADQTVVYDSVASARPAFDQVRRVAAACATAAPRPVAGSTRLPVVPSYAVTFTLARPGAPTHVLLVVQQRGDVVDLLTLTSPRPVTVRQQRVLLHEAEATGTRLARLPLASDGA